MKSATKIPQALTGALGGCKEDLILGFGIVTGCFALPEREDRVRGEGCCLGQLRAGGARRGRETHS